MASQTAPLAVRQQSFPLQIDPFPLAGRKRLEAGEKPAFYVGLHAVAGEEYMRAESQIIAGLGGLALTACDERAERVASTPPPIGSDDIAGGYYTWTGMSHPSNALPLTPPGERG